MMFLKRRKVKKTAHEVLRHTHHVRRMREDILEPTALTAIADGEQALRDALETHDIDQIQNATDAQAQTLHQIAPAGRGGALRENFEVIVVAVAAAMALRAYFIQPFKIPTGSMQPTLYGIHSVEKASPGFLDRYPLKLAKFALTGAWYSERRAKATGVLSMPKSSETDPSVYLFDIGGVTHKIPKDTINQSQQRYELNFHPGETVTKGALLWSGIVTHGDHLFVNKVIWNFRKPKRGEVMVFKTKSIPTLPQGTHYIKRMCGLPNERISIQPPHLVVNQKIVMEPEPIARIARRDPGYNGYQLNGKLNSPDLEWPLNEKQYFAMGDNTQNSRDSRYWGAVPERNLVGPAAVVYWPLSSRWGLIH